MSEKTHTVSSVTRRRFLVCSSAAVAAGALRTVPGFAQATEPGGSFQDLRGGVGVFTLRGGTIGYLVTPDGGVVVDSQYPDTAPVCLEGLRSRTPRTFDLVINTHHHADHTGGNGVFKPAARKILAHARVPDLQKAAAAQAGNADQQVYPDATFTEVWREEIGRETVAARHHGPAHTGGDAVVTFERANVVHMGDLVFNRVHPRVDRPGGASITNWIATLGKVAEGHARDTIYVFGHGSAEAGITGARADLQHMADYLSAVIDYVRKGLADGRSREDIAALEAVPGFEHVTTLVPALSLAAVLGVAYDELTGA